MLLGAEGAGPFAQWRELCEERDSVQVCYFLKPVYGEGRNPHFCGGIWHDKFLL